MWFCKNSKWKLSFIWNRLFAQHTRKKGKWYGKKQQEEIIKQDCPWEVSVFELSWNLWVRSWLISNSLVLMVAFMIKWMSKTVLKEGKNPTEYFHLVDTYGKVKVQSCWPRAHPWPWHDYRLLCVSDPHMFFISGSAVSLLCHSVTVSFSPTFLLSKPGSVLLSFPWVAWGLYLANSE